MRVATFNIQHGAPRDGGRVDADLVAAACASLRADVLALQEVDRRLRRSGRIDLVAVVAAATGLHPTFGRTLRSGCGQYGNLLLTRDAPQRVVTERLPKRPGLERRGFVAAALSGLTVGASHLSVSGPANREELAEVARRLDVFAEPDAPRILLGDFNLGPGAVAADLNPLGYTAAGGGPSYPSDAPRARIDHVVVAGGLVIGAVEVVETAISDHRAVVAEVSLPR